MRSKTKREHVESLIDGLASAPGGQPHDELMEMLPQKVVESVLTIPAEPHENTAMITSLIKMLTAFSKEVPATLTSLKDVLDLQLALHVAEAGQDSDECILALAKKLDAAQLHITEGTEGVIGSYTDISEKARVILESTSKQRVGDAFAALTAAHGNVDVETWKKEL